MSDDFEARHVKAEHYELTRQGGLSASALARLIHDHILSSCPHCREEWERLQESRPEVRALLSRVEAPRRPAAPEDPAPERARYATAFSAAARQLEEDARALRKDRRRARRQLRLLLDTPPDERHDRIFSARTRFRSRAFAEILLQEARQQVRNAPGEAENLASLVPVVLHWTPGAHGTPWAAALEAQSRAHVANALRVTGDLPTADRHFAELRRDLAATPIEDAEANAEIASLEASLRIDQRRFKEAGELLDLAKLLYEHADLDVGQARVLIQRANVYRHLSDPSAALDCLNQASSILEVDEQAFLYLCAITSQALCLTALDRHQEAWELLEANMGAYENSDEPWVPVSLRDLQGRILTGLGRYAEAEESYISCCEGALILGRHYDAALACLDLAEVYLQQGRSSEVTEMAAGLVSAFRARNVSREALAALIMLQQAASEERVTHQVLKGIRRRVLKARGSVADGATLC